MNTNTEKKIKFRVKQSREKLSLSHTMLKSGNFSDSIIFSYLSMFYAVRLLLIERDIDSDNYSKIRELAKRYYEPAGWHDIDITGILRESEASRDSAEGIPICAASKEEAERFYYNASVIMSEVLQKVSSSSQIST
jgi:uncharacterized protein (UPF0332 family)